MWTITFFIHKLVHLSVTTFMQASKMLIAINFYVYTSRQIHVIFENFYDLQVPCVQPFTIAFVV